MARSSTRTWLSLDEWAQIIGINPLHFNQLSSDEYIPNTVCGDVWFQYSWQHSDRLGRADIARAIQQAEQIIAQEVGYNLIPDWTKEERYRFSRISNPGAYSLNGRTPKGQFRSVELNRGYIIEGGVETKSLIEAGVAVVTSDGDTDGFAETVTLTFNTTVTDENEIRVYYPAKNGSDAWEIRPLDSVSISGGVATVTFKVWLLVAANQLDDINPDPLDPDDPDTFETTVDVYRVYNDPATQVQFMWENDGYSPVCGNSTCVACQFSTQAGCFHLRDDRLGFAVPAPATWDSSTEQFTTKAFAGCRGPDQVRFWYRSGNRDFSLDRPDVQMADYWKYAVAYFAASLLDRDVCGCSNVNSFIERWRTDISFHDQDEGFTITPEMLGNRLGTSRGALYAWRRIQQNGVKVLK